ncbi:MAG: DUF1987 domain-containing protein [Bacteroidetes bacterium]|jgi:hypothetical protein|nr:DUF1987 domain-containing protein [Bacteroidota bacterium]
MESITREATSHSPYIDFNTDGFIKIEGRGRLENTIEFFEPLFKWVSDYDQENLKMDINLEYFNTAFSKCLMEIFKLLNKNEKIKAIDVKWYYFEEDTDALESGEMLRDLFSRKFKFEFVIIEE